MKNFVKILALVLSLVMLMSVFAGCAPKEKYRRAEEPLGADLTNEEKFAEHVTLTWCFVDTGLVDSPGWERVSKAINEIAEREINATINFEIIPLGEYTQKMALKYAANERWDIAFCGTQWNPFANAVSMKVLEPLSAEYLETYMPGVMSYLDPLYFDALTVDGNLYGVPLEQIYVRQNGIRFEVEWAEELGFDWQSVQDLEDLEPYFDLLLQNNYTECFLSAGEGMMENLSSYMGFDNLISSIFPGAIYFNQEDCKVVNQYETEEFKYIANLMKKWHDAGYFTDAALNGGQANKFYEERDGISRHPVTLEPVVKPGGDVFATRKLKTATVKTVGIGNAVLTSSSVAQTALVVSRNAEYPGRALAFIDLLNTNEELLNLICYGQRGEDWFWEDEANKVISVDTSAYPGTEAFFVGNTFLSYLIDSEQIGCWEETMLINATTPISPLYGFTFDAMPVRGKIAAINGNIDAYLNPILAGMGNGTVDEAIAELNKFLYDNGLQDILDEMQRQVDAWLASK